MSALTEIGALISHDPSDRGGRPVIAGIGISVKAIAIDSNHGLTLEEIVADRPQLSLAQVHAALAHYYANGAQIDADIAAEALAYD